ncbi:MAG: hypothetical protein M3Y65_17255 [Pseudomonadota bacterium]|nr:hypothetical protein [Pseudomonadota bacterium]
MKPVTLNNNIAIKHMAELIQCHWCKFFSQTARPAPGKADGAGVWEGAALVATVAPAGCSGVFIDANDNHYHLTGQRWM